MKLLSLDCESKSFNGILKLFKKRKNSFNGMDVIGPLERFARTLNINQYFKEPVIYGSKIKSIFRLIKYQISPGESSQVRTKFEH